MARVDTLPQVPFPLPDPAIVLQDVWITQGGRDFSISPTRLGSIQQGTIAPVNPFENQLWWDSSGTLIPGQTVLRAWQKGAWVEVGPFGDAFGNVTVPGTLTVTGGEIKGANAQGFLEIASNLAVDGGTIGGKNNGPLTTTSDFTVGGKLTVDGTSTLKGATTVTGGLTTDTLTTSGAATIGGLLTTQTLTITGTGTGATGGFQANTGTFSGFLTVNGTLTANSGVVWKGGATGDTLTLNGTAPQLTLSNGTSNWIQYGNAGVSPPTLSTHSPGTKLLFEPIASPTSYDYAIGLQFGAIWYSAAAHAFYGLNGVPATLQVDNSGNLGITTPTLTINPPTGGGGNLVVNGNTTINGVTTLDGTLHINNGDLDIANGNIYNTSGTVNVIGSLNLTGGVTVGSDIVVHNTATVGLLYTNSGADINGIIPGTGVAFDVNGPSYFGGNVTMAGGLNVSGVFSGTTNTLIVNGPSEITGALLVNGLNSIFQQGLVVNAASGQAVALQVSGGFVSNANAASSGIAGIFNGAVNIFAGSGPGQALLVNGSINCSDTPGQTDALFAKGNIQATGNVIANGTVLTSDKRVKTDIESYYRGTAAINKLRPVRYKIEGMPYHGLVADEVEEVIPEAVGEYDGKKTLDPMVIIATLINTVRELSEKVEKLELDRVQSSARQ